VLVSEVMLHQTQVARVLDAWPGFIAQFPTPEATARAGPADVIRAWGRLGYPRRARWLYDGGSLITASGWPADLRSLPGIGRYTAAAIAAQADGTDVPAVEVNIRRVVERVRGGRLTEAEAEQAMVTIGRPLRGRDRLLALMDVGACCCHARVPDCRRCPLVRRCATRGALVDERRARQPRYQGSFRERRGTVLARLRDGAAPTRELDGEALGSLVADGLAVVVGRSARLP
jgi:A/G-specific adenine glycosylase